VTDVSGVFAVNSYMRGAVSNTSYRISSFDVSDNQIMNLSVSPDPSSANINTAFGFDETIEYYPNIT